MTSKRPNSRRSGPGDRPRAFSVPMESKQGNRTVHRTPEWRLCLPKFWGMAMRWFGKTKQVEVWDEPVEGLVGDIEAAKRIRVICRAATDSAHRIGDAADRSNTKLKNEDE